MVIEKEQVLNIVAGWISLNKGYTSPPHVKMLEDGSVVMDKEGRFNELKKQVEQRIASKTTSPYEYMKKYGEMVEAEDYDFCRAITEVLKPLGYDTKDTHKHIPSIT